MAGHCADAERHDGDRSLHEKGIAESPVRTGESAGRLPACLGGVAGAQGRAAKIDRTAVEPKQVSGSGCGVATAAALALTLLLWGAGVELAVAQDGDGEGIKSLVGEGLCNLGLTNSQSSVNIGFGVSDH